MEIEVSEHAGARLPPGRVRPAAATHAGRGFRRGGLGPHAPRRTGFRRRRVEAGVDQARVGTRRPRGGGSRRRLATPDWPSSGMRPTRAACSRSTTSPPSRDELTTRRVEPVQVVTIDGHWYLDAFCHRAGDMRRFRVDRIRDARPLAQPGSDGAHRTRPPEDMYVPGPGAREVHLRLGPDAQWVPESVPVRDHATGRRRVGDRCRARRVGPGVVRAPAVAARTVGRRSSRRSTSPVSQPRPHARSWRSIAEPVPLGSPTMMPK